MNMKHKAPFYMGGGIGTELDLQRFAEVNNPYQATINSNIITSGSIQPPLVDLSYYARDNITNYETITTIPQENIEYLGSGLIATDIYSIFNNCEALTSIPWNEFDIDTSQCTSMHSMFNRCKALTSLDLSSFNTSKVTNMFNMFNECNVLTSLDLSSFNTSKVTDMGYMFQNCQSLQEIICPDGFDLSSTTTNALRLMFYGCTSYSGEPLHFKNVPQDLDFSRIYGKEGKHYVIDTYKN